MKYLLRWLIVFSGIFVALYVVFFYTEKTQIAIQSPNGKIKVKFNLSENGTPIYEAFYNQTQLIFPSELGLDLAEDRDLIEGFEIVSIVKSSFDSTWNPIWGEFSTIKNSYNEMTILLKEKLSNPRQLALTFRVYNDGVAYRYIIPDQPYLSEFFLHEEHSEFRIKEDLFAWWIPANYVSDEMLYNSTPLSRVDSLVRNDHVKGSNELYMVNDAKGKAAFNTPLTMVRGDGIYISIHEAAQIDYSDMTLALSRDKKGFLLKSELAPNLQEKNIKVKGKSPFNTPWRTITVGENAGKLLESTLIVNLNDPNSLPDASTWCKPMKYMGIWWGYHIGKYSWDPGHETKPHGATTENAKRHIDFCALYSIPGLLIEGWNGFLSDSAKATMESISESTFKKGLRDYTKSHADFDLEEVVLYAKSKGVEIIVHNETMGEVLNYESQLEKAFAYYAQLGIHYVKTGYAWYIENKKHYHHDQFMIQHYTKVMELAAKYKINLIVHESNKDTGLRRKYPNMMTREAVRGNEYNAWDIGAGNLPEHETIIPFTRLLAGPVDYTPGIFDLTFDSYKKKQRVHTTKAKQLSLYVILYSPLTMVADLPENYENDIEGFDFIQSVPVTWDESRVVQAAIGDYVVVARRSGKDWYIGGCTDENMRDIQFTLEFLDPNTSYTATIFADATETNLSDNPTKMRVQRDVEVKSTTQLSFNLASSGGFAVCIKNKN